MGKKLKTLIALLVIGSLVCSCSGSSAVSKNSIVVTESLKDKPVLVGNLPCEFPLVTEDTTLNFLITGYENVDQNDVFVWKKYEEMTGVKINWTNVEKAKKDETVSSALMNKNNIDLFMRCRIPANLLTQYGESGYIYNLTKDDMLKKNAPNCWAYLQSHPDALASVMNPDGSIYALPQINSGPELRVARKIYINKQWLENVRMDVPTTTEEFYQVLKAFKEQDANGNGDPNDEVPLCTQDWISIQEALFGAFGLANRGVHNKMIDYNEETGKVRLIASSDSYKDFLEYFNLLYSEGLMDSNTFSITMEQWLNNAENDRIGAFSNTNLATLPADKKDNWVAVENALEGPNGDKMWTAIRANFHSVGAAVIPATCKKPELVLRWLDYFWTDEGTLFYHMGIENESFVAKEDGTYDYAPKVYEKMETGGVSFDDVVACYSPYPGGNNPTVEIAPYFKGGEMADIPAAAARQLFQYGPDEFWPCFTFTTEENANLGIYEADIQKYIDSVSIDFITGAKPFSEWDEYQSQLLQLGDEELLTVYQAAVDRYEALMKQAK